MPSCEQIKQAVTEYNNGQGFSHDLAIRSALAQTQSLIPSFGRFVTEVSVVSDWGSIRLDGFPFGDRLAMASEIEACWPMLHAMRVIVTDNWAAETTLLVHAVNGLVHTNLLSMPSGRQLSFVSKYLHWCVNNGFPIWDSRAPKALGNTGGEPSWDTYRSWVTQAREEAAKHETCCLNELRLTGESLIRTLDKALYIIGAPKKESS